MATYYIATTGNDTTGDGTLGNPWKTFNKAFTGLAVGDTVYARAGTYVENIANNIPVNGTAWGTSTQITVSAYQSETVVLQPTLDDAVLRFDNLGPVSGEKKYYEFIKLIFDASDLFSAGRSCVQLGHKEDGITVGAHHIRFTNCEARGSRDGHGCLWKGDNASTSYEWIGGSLHDMHWISPGSQNHGFYIQTDDNLVEKVEVYNIDNGYAFHLFLPEGNRTIIRKNVIHNATQGMLIAGDANRVENCLFYNLTTVDSGVAIQDASDTGSTNSVFVYNSFWGNWNASIVLTTNSVGATVRNNVVQNTTGSANSILSDGATNYLITHNTMDKILTINAGSGTQNNNLSNVTGEFVNPPSDFHLTAAAQSNNHAIPISVTEDYTGATRGGAPDAGAYEGAGSSLTTIPVEVIRLLRT